MSSKLKVKMVDFKVYDGVQLHDVKPYDVDSELREMDIHQLRSFLASGCTIRATKLDNGDYILRHKVPGFGGGPVLGSIVCIAGFTLTGVAAVGTLFGVTVVAGPGAGFSSACSVATAGTAATAYATAAATASPTP